MPSRQTIAYIALIAACYAIGLLVGWPDHSFTYAAYDWMFRQQTPEAWTPQSVVVGIDEPTLNEGGGPRALRSILATALHKIAQAEPSVVALDITLVDRTNDDPSLDPKLAAALAEIHPLVLPVDLITVDKASKWEDPLPIFQQSSPALGHVHRTQSGAVQRQLPLEEIAAGKRRWAVAVEAYAAANRQQIVDSPDEVLIGDVLIPAPRKQNLRLMYIRYLADGIPTVSASQLDQNLAMLRGKAVFVGVTAISMARDRVWIPYNREIAGVEVHAHAYETIARKHFLTDPRTTLVPLVCVWFAVAPALIFALRSGWLAYGLSAIVLAMSAWIPILYFRHDVVFPFFATVAVAFLSTGGAASFQYFFVQRELKRTESERSRYQQAIHWAAHEMRTPLTAIQGSSEIMTRYALPDDKRQQLSEMINSESKRLAKMIQTFLDIERLSDGQMEVKREPFVMTEVVTTCIRRAAPIAERKKISLLLDNDVEGALVGDRELMEYAFYNLLTNAVKYSPGGTEVHVGSEQRGSEIRLWVRDQGIGMDAKELKSIFKKFYRTKRAEASGEVGTGIGLSIVEQIVKHHHGRIDVSSEPGKGSCFTMVLTAGNSAAASRNAETSDRRG